MISDQIVKSEFIAGILDRDIKNIYSAMSLIAKSNVYIEGKNLQAKKRRGTTIGERSGALMRSLENPNYTIQGLDGKFIVSANIVLHERFLDMKKLGNRRIYNRQVWGILYNNALPDIKYNYGNEIHDVIGESLKKAFENSHTSTENSHASTGKGKSYAQVRGRES